MPEIKCPECGCLDCERIDTSPDADQYECLACEYQFWSDEIDDYPRTGPAVL